MAEFARSTALPHVEARRSCQENTCYRPHTHDSFSIGLIDHGTAIFAGPLSGSVHLHPGDVIVIPAGQVHQCNPHGGTWRYQMIHMDEKWAANLTARAFTSQAFSSITVLCSPTLHHQASAWVDSIFTNQTATDIESGFSALMQSIMGTAPDHQVINPDNKALIDQLSPVMDRLRDDKFNPSLDELAAIVGMSRYQLVRAMKQATGLTPLAWRQNIRVA
ncbi:AraC family transcriptional regulator [Jonesiaceae bacterium BS-20]|uniref:AraC family transcriptional regulator n=1 Tax=Jonesiaceae bacterium BS-20 TaxID=3120821 RepID=A0AAU7DW07_9MICO